jgi:cytochrome c biogenesis protein CcdA
MATAGRTRREVLIIGLAFIVGVYVTYFLIGLCLYGVLSTLKAFYLVADIVYYLAFGLCVVFAALSLRDAWVMRRGADPKEMVLRLPERLKTRLQLYMSRGVRAREALFGAVLLTAAVVSLIEAACTGQVYFPVLNGLVREETTRNQGLVLLAWYNFLFVLPLAGVLGLAMLGVTSERLAKFSRGHLAWAKLGLAAAFIFMAVWMWSGMVWPPGRR